jgi:hypothetical protein
MSAIVPKATASRQNVVRRDGPGATVIATQQFLFFRVTRDFVGAAEQRDRNGDPSLSGLEVEEQLDFRDPLDRRASTVENAADVDADQALTHSARARIAPQAPAGINSREYEIAGIAWRAASALNSPWGLANNPTTPITSPSAPS